MQEADTTVQMCVCVSPGLELLEGYQALHRQLGTVRSLSGREVTERDSLKKVSDCLSTWRKLLIAQLPVVYPIKQVLPTIIASCLDFCDGFLVLSFFLFKIFCFYLSCPSVTYTSLISPLIHYLHH